MTPAARYAAAIDVLDRWLDGMPVAQALKAWGRGARYAGSKDRAAVQDHVYDVLRCKGTAARLGGGDTGRSLILGYLRLQGADPTEVFTGQGHAPPPLSDDEATPPGAVPAPDLDIPDWLRPRIADRFGPQADALFGHFQRRAPLYLRVNTRKADVPTAVTALRGDGIEATPDPLLDTALEVVAGARALRRADAYISGLVEIQDMSVQRAVAAVAWPGTGRILDYCAGAGGKSLAIACRSEADLFAHDALPRRMSDLPERAQRAGVRLATLEPDRLTDMAPFDAVLCDVPCSGSGTWRRDPEAKWRLTPSKLADLVATQAGILQGASRLVAPGGMLVYMTCSILDEENDAQVTAFLAANPSWTVTRSTLDTPLTASDGFFLAVLTRRGEKSAAISKHSTDH